VTALLPAPGTSTEALRPGETRTFSVQLPLGASRALPVSASATLRMIALDDGSALGESREVRQLADGRLHQAEVLTQTLDDAASASRSPNPRAAFEALNGKSAAQGLMRQQLVPLFDSPQRLEEVLSTYRELRDLYSKQSTLREVAEDVQQGSGPDKSRPL